MAGGADDRNGANYKILQRIRYDCRRGGGRRLKSCAGPEILWRNTEKITTFHNLWISWIQNGGCYARFIQTSTYDKSTAQTTVNFIRGLGGTVSGVPSITAGGSAYNAPSIVATTLNAGTTLGGSGLTINIVSVDNSAIGEAVDNFTTNTGACTNFTVVQSYTMSTLPANCTYTGAGTGMTLTISTLASWPQRRKSQWPCLQKEAATFQVKRLQLT